MRNLFLPAVLTDAAVFRLALAALLGAVIGLERGIHGRTAGLTTHLLVGLGSGLFMLLSIAMAGMAREGIRADPGRIAAQIVTGIGFIGAGAILKEGFSIRGLTTAASLWVAAAVGATAGAGFAEIALVADAAAVLALTFLHYLERAVPHESHRVLSLRVPLETPIASVIATVRREQVTVLQFDCDRDHARRAMTLRLSLRLRHRGSTDRLAYGIVEDVERAFPAVRRIRWIRS